MGVIFNSQSDHVTLGMELELQLIKRSDFDLAAKAKELMDIIEQSKYKKLIKPEITQSMIELNSSICDSPQTLLVDLNNISKFITHKANDLNVYIAGGGVHPFQFWSLRKIFPSPRFIQKANEHGYLSKQITVFAMHVHVGCSNGEDALYLTHLFTRFLPQLIAVSASSPFYQGAVTGFQSTRNTLFTSLPTNGVMPYLTTWDEFSNYFNNAIALGLVETMKDFYWDVRPKPEFGTVEIRICDMPLTLSKAITIAAYIQTLARYLLLERPMKVQPDLYMVYPYNRFQASRFGYDADFINAYSFKHSWLGDDILETIEKIQPHAIALGNQDYLSRIAQWTSNNQTDANTLLNIYHDTNDLEKVVQEQCRLWKESL